jgi:hypothetical protein
MTDAKLTVSENPRMPASARYNARDAEGKAVGVGSTPEEAVAEWHRIMSQPEEEEAP